MFLTISPEAQTQVVQMFPPEYQTYVAVAVAFAPIAVGLFYLFIKPRMDKSATQNELLLVKQQYEDLKATIPTKEEINEMVNTSLSEADKLTIRKNIIDLEWKLSLAKTDEERLRIQSEIDRQTAALNG